MTLDPLDPEKVHSAVEALKAKLSALGESYQQVGLAAKKAADGMVSLAGAKYVHASINPDWDPKDHPRNPANGEFIKALGGFIFGKAKKAEFPGKSGLKKIELDLKPGDVAYQTPAKNIAVSHPDDTFTLYNAATGKPTTIPAGSHHAVLDLIDSKQAVKVAENPGTKVEAADEAEAADKIAHPDQYGKTATKAAAAKKTAPAPTLKKDAEAPKAEAKPEAPKAEAKPEAPKAAPFKESVKQPASVAKKAPAKKAPAKKAPAMGGAKEIPAPPALKPGKTKFTNKQYKEFQEKAAGAHLAIGADGKPIKSGSWVEGPDKKPYLVHASPYGGNKVTAYRWVSTKQQASNLEKENLFTLAGLSGATAIPDPSGKPYVPIGQSAPDPEEKKQVSAEDLKHGSLMSKAITGNIPATSTAFKKFVSDNEGAKIPDFDLKSGDWVELEGKPYRVHLSPNDGNIALAKWVSTKKQASNNFYEFPASVLEPAKKIDDPTGKVYKPLPKVEPEVYESTTGKGGTFKHPVSGETFDVPEDWKVFQHKASSDTFLIADPEKPETGVFYTKKGVKQKAPSHTLAKFADNYVELKPTKIEPEDEPEAPAQEDSVLTNPVTDVVPYGGQKYHKKADGNWYLPSGAGAPSVHWGVLEDTLAEKKEFEGLVADAEAGDVVVSTGSNGHKVFYTLKDDGWYNSATDAKSATKEQMLKVVSAADTWEKFELEFIAKKDQKQPQVEAPAPPQSVDEFEEPPSYISNWATPNPSFFYHDADKQPALVVQSLVPGDEVWVDSADSPSTYVINSPSKGEVWGFNPAKMDLLQLDMALLGSLTKGKKKSYVVPSEPPSQEVIEAYYAKNLSADEKEALAEAAEETAPGGDFWKGDDGSSANVFVHPVSGVVFNLQPGDIVHKHKSTENAYIVERPGAEKPIFFFNQYGKLYKPKEKQKNLNTGYQKVDTWPGKKEGEKTSESGTEVDETPGTKATIDHIKSAVPGDQLHVIGASKELFTYKKVSDGTWEASHEDIDGAHLKDATMFSVVENPVLTSTFHPKDVVATHVGSDADEQDIPDPDPHPFTKFESPTISDLEDAPEGSKASYSANGHHTFTKKNGDWEDGFGGSHSSADIHATGSYSEDYGFALYVPKDEENHPTAPWGGKESVGENPSAEQEKPKKAPAKKSKKKGLPKSYTLPNGETIDLKPGEAVGKVEWGGQVYYLHVNSKKNEYGKVYDASGNKTNHWSLAMWTPAKMKKDIKADPNDELLAEFPLPTLAKDKPDLSHYEPADYSGTHVPGYYYGDPPAPESIAQWTFESIKHDFAIGWGGGLHGWSPKYPDPNGGPDLVSWDNLPIEQKMERIAATAEIFGAAHQAAEKASEGVTDKAEKAALTKTKNAAILLYRMATLAQELANPDTDWDDDQFETEFELIATKFSNPGPSLGKFKGKVPHVGWLAALQDADKQRKFKNSLEDLGFDPYDATTEEYDAYAKSKGFHHLAALDPADQKTWVLAQIDDPTLSPSQKNVVAEKAQHIKTKIAAADLAAALQKTKKPVPDQPPPSVQGAWAKAHMKSSYSWTDSNSGGNYSAKHLTGDDWLLSSSPGGQDVTVAAELVQLLVNNAFAQGTNVTESEDYAYGADPKTLIEHAENAHGISYVKASAAELDAAIASTNYSFPHTLLGVKDKASWLTAHATGDYVAKWVIESKAHALSGSTPTNGNSHPGSPTSLMGPVAYKALVAKLLEIPEGKWYLKDPSTLDYTDQQKVLEHLGVKDQYENLEKASQSISDLQTPFQLWQEHHPQSVLKDYVPDVKSGPHGGTPALKPAQVSDEVWDMVSLSTPDTDFSTLYGTGLDHLTEPDLDAALASSFKAKGVGLIEPLLGGVPIHLKRLAVWASGGENDTQTEVLAAVAAKAKSGEFLSEDTPVWISPTGVQFPISPGASVLKGVQGGTLNNQYLIMGPPGPDGTPTSGWKYNVGTGEMTALNSSYVNSYWKDASDAKAYAEFVFTMPNPATWEKAKKHNPDFLETYWDESEAVEQGLNTPFSHTLSGPLLTAELKKHSEALNASWPFLHAQMKSLPEPVRQGMLAALEDNYGGGKHLLDILEYKASQNHYASMGSQGLFNAGQPWNKHLSMGQMSDEDIQNLWTMEAKDAYIKYFGLGDFGQIGPHLNGLINPEVPEAPDTGPSWTNLPDWKNLQLTTTGKSLGGMHSKSHLVDNEGNEWMSKTFKSDPNAGYRIDAETAGMQISSLFGFRAPVANSQNVNGTYSYLQHLKPRKKDFSSVSPNDLTVKQLQQAMEEHLLDWLISNHDTHSQNLMMDPNGNVFGIDKGQAFKFFPDDKLAVGYLPPGNGAAVWYDQFYYGVQNGSIDKGTADEVTKYVLRRAQKIAKDKDEEFRERLEFALAKRDFWPNKYPSREKFIEALIERKHNSFDDFVDFYKSVYEKSPYDWDIDTENLNPPKVGEAHVAVSDDYAKEVSASGVHGKAIFFNSAHIEDAHFLSYTAKEPDGSTTLLGHTKVRPDGDKALVEWLSKQTVEDLSNQPVAQTLVAQGPSHSVLPNNDAFFSAMVAYSKTVSSHNASGDHQYNQGTVNFAQYGYQQILAALEKIEEWEKSHPGEPFVGEVDGQQTFGKFKAEMVTMEQHNAFKDMLETYRGYWEKVKSYEGTDQKVSPHFTQFLYTPTPEANNEAKYHGKGLPPNPALVSPGTSVKVKDGKVYTKGENGIWTDSDGNVWPDPAKEWSPDLAVVSGDEEDEDEVSNTVSVGSKVVKVTRKKNTMRTAQLDLDSGELTLTGAESNEYFNTQLSGYMYEIDFGDTKIKYLPHEPGTALTELGKLTFEKQNWSGDAASMEEVFDLLRQMGLNLDPASEESMELFYWRHLTGVVGDRKSKSQAKWKKVISDAKDAEKKNGSTSELLAAYRAAWATAIGQEKVDKANYRPQFSRTRVHNQKDFEGNFTTGRPYWLRPDVDIDWLRNVNSAAPPSHNVNYGGGNNNFYKIILSGGLYSAEEKWRLYGASGNVAGQGTYTSGGLGGVSAEADYKNHGSSGQVFTYAGGAKQGNGNVYMHPKVMFRTQNYSSSNDSYGDQSAKTNSPWEVHEINATSQYELMIKNSLSVLDDIAFIEFPNSSIRDAAIKQYKDRGITEIHGMPIEKIFVTSISASEKKAIYNKLWDDFKAEQEAWEKEKESGLA